MQPLHVVKGRGVGNICGIQVPTGASLGTFLPDFYSKWLWQQLQPEKDVVVGLRLLRDQQKCWLWGGAQIDNRRWIPATRERISCYKLHLQRWPPESRGSCSQNLNREWVWAICRVGCRGHYAVLHNSFQDWRTHCLFCWEYCWLTASILAVSGNCPGWIESPFSTSCPISGLHDMHALRLPASVTGWHMFMTPDPCPSFRMPDMELVVTALELSFSYVQSCLFPSPIGFNSETTPL